MIMIRTYTMRVSLCDAADPDTPVHDKLEFRIPFEANRRHEPAAEDIVTALANAISDMHLPVTSIDVDSIESVDTYPDTALRIMYCGNDTRLKACLRAYNNEDPVQYEISTQTYPGKTVIDEIIDDIEAGEQPPLDAIIIDKPLIEDHAAQFEAWAAIKNRLGDDTLLILTLDNMTPASAGIPAKDMLEATGADFLFTRNYDKTDCCLKYSASYNNHYFVSNEDVDNLAQYLVDTVRDWKFNRNDIVENCDK